MPARVKEASLASRTGRLKLAPRPKPYYRRVSADTHLGYYKPSAPGVSGSWLGRRYLGDGKYSTETIGSADDYGLADGQTILTCDQATATVQAWSQGRALATQSAPIAPTTVRMAIELYITERIARHPRAGHDAQLRLNRHVQTTPLANLQLSDLDEDTFRQWLGGVQRGGRAAKTNSSPPAKATLARLLNDVRAALTEACRRAKVPSTVTLAIRDGLRAPRQPDRARPKVDLGLDDIQRLISMADSDFAALLVVLASTGCRFDQACRLLVADFQIRARRLMVPVSHKGNGAKQIRHTAIPLAEGVVERLEGAAADRSEHEPLLLRWHRQQTGGVGQWERTERRGWRSPAEMTRPWKQALAGAGLPAGITPYALRQASIVRHLKHGTAVRLVASMHDTSVAMIERHYSKFIVDESEMLLRAASLRLW